VVHAHQGHRDKVKEEKCSGLERLSDQHCNGASTGGSVATSTEVTHERWYVANLDRTVSRGAVAFLVK
jgi:hypothetical protein